MIRNPHVVSVCPKARNSHVVSDCQPSNPPDPEPADTNTHYPRTRYQRRDNFKLREGVKHSVTTWGIRIRVRINVLTTSRPLAHNPVVEKKSIQISQLNFIKLFNTQNFSLLDLIHQLIILFILIHKFLKLCPLFKAQTLFILFKILIINFKQNYKKFPKSKKKY